MKKVRFKNSQLSICYSVLHPPRDVYDYEKRQMVNVTLLSMIGEVPTELLEDAREYDTDAVDVYMRINDIDNEKIGL